MQAASLNGPVAVSQSPVEGADRAVQTLAEWSAAEIRFPPVVGGLVSEQGQCRKYGRLKFGNLYIEDGIYPSLEQITVNFVATAKSAVDGCGSRRFIKAYAIVVPKLNRCCRSRSGFTHFLPQPQYRDICRQTIM